MLEAEIEVAHIALCKRVVTTPDGLGSYQLAIVRAVVDSHGDIVVVKLMGKLNV